MYGVTVKVKCTHGNEERTFLMLTGLLRWHSSYFAAALDAKGFGIDGQREIEITDSVRAFEAFRCWIYTGKLKDPSLSDASSPAKAPVNDDLLSQELLCRTWVFADLRGIPALKNAAIDMLHEHISMSWSTNIRMVRFVYNNTLEGSSLRAFVIDVFTLTKETSRIAKLDPMFLTVRFMQDIMLFQMEQAQNSDRRLGQKQWAQLSRCKWNDHSGPGYKIRLESRQLAKSIGDDRETQH
ncbi:hypothetical protein N0V90_009198 [Kalmusia sp. IMI 367209]|nr:hypothetical protein N0V90_009198 [Kalmusia sp. IMI 367209]